MTISESIEAIKPLINYDFNSSVRDTLFPLDYFVKRAYEDALRQIAKKYPIVQKSVFIPLVANTHFYDINLANLSKENFEFVAPINITVFNPDNKVVGIEQGLLKRVLQNSYQDIYKIAFKLAGSNYQFRASVNVENSLGTVGTFDKLVTVTNLGGTLVTASNSVLNSYMINLDKADKGLYSYRQITSASSTSPFTLDSAVITDINPAWLVNEKVYIVDTLPLMLLYTFQGLPKMNYFDTETEIPIQEQYLDDLDDLAVTNIFNILTTRFPEQAQVYMAKINSGLLRTPRQILFDVGVRVTQNMDNPTIELYQPWKEVHYGR
jgi:hypothetical protein